MLYGVSPFDPLMLTSIVAVLTLVTIISASLPAIRAASIDPLQTLRAD
jgi:putative ABC transport system permease protein